MKKYLIIIVLLIGLTITTGCGKKKTLVCSSENDIMNMKIEVEYKDSTINKMLLSYTYDLSKYGDNDIESFKEQDFCSFIENSSDNFQGAIKKCKQNIEESKLHVDSEIDVSKLSNDDLNKKSKIEDVQKSFENAGSKCEIK